MDRAGAQHVPHLWTRRPPELPAAEPRPTLTTMTDPTPRTARRTHGFTESVIREMTRVAAEHDPLNLAQGFPDFPAPEALKVAAAEAIRRDVNQYAVTWGSPRIRRALGVAYHEWYGLEIEPDRQVTVTCGATEAMASALLAVVDPGDEVIVLEPFYENYGPDAILCGARPVWVPMERTRRDDRYRVQMQYRGFPAGRRGPHAAHRDRRAVPGGVRCRVPPHRGGRPPAAPRAAGGGGPDPHRVPVAPVV